MQSTKLASKGSITRYNQKCILGRPGTTEDSGLSISSLYRRLQEERCRRDWGLHKGRSRRDFPWATEALWRSYQCLFMEPISRPTPNPCKTSFPQFLCIHGLQLPRDKSTPAPLKVPGHCSTSKRWEANVVALDHRTEHMYCFHEREKV